MIQPVLDIQISAGYGAATTLHEVSFQLQQGERAGVVGGSGAGKTTLVLALLGLLPWRRGWVSGRILLGGRNLLECSERDLRAVRGRLIALVPQSPASSLNPALSIEAHFKELWRAHNPSRSALADRMQQLVQRVDLPTDTGFLKRKPAEISIGQAQRVIIALALLHRPQLLIADEPTSALDVCTQREVINLLLDVSKEDSTALLYVSHDLLSVFQLCERMLVIDKGVLVDALDLSATHPQQTHSATQRLLDTLPVPVQFLQPFTAAVSLA